MGRVMAMGINWSFSSVRGRGLALRGELHEWRVALPPKTGVPGEASMTPLSLTRVSGAILFSHRAPAAFPLKMHCWQS